MQLASDFIIMRASHAEIMADNTLKRPSENDRFKALRTKWSDVGRVGFATNSRLGTHLSPLKKVIPKYGPATSYHSR
jgi:hypothetical protein